MNVEIRRLLDELRDEAAACESRKGIAGFLRDSRRYAVLTRIAARLESLLVSFPPTEAN